MSGNGTYLDPKGQYVGLMSDKEFRTVVEAANILNNKQMNQKQARKATTMMLKYGVEREEDLPASAF
tara:strand:- start:1452 stop:1652 length:201 start_codon:yes stop_codon:yes gene_type:complete